MKNKIKEEDLKIISKEYLSGNISMKQLADKFGVCTNTISNYLKKLKIRKINTDPNFSKHKKYSLDQDILQNIHLFDNAQFLGLLYADGMVSSHRYMIALSLREDDKEYLDEWRTKLLKTNKPLYYAPPRCNKYPNGNFYTSKLGSSILNITCKKIHSDALKIGLCNCKSKKPDLGMPQLNENVKPAFILGLFEGDGHVTFTIKGRSTFAIDSNLQLVTDVSNYLRSVGIHSVVSKIRNRSGRVIVSHKEDVLKLYLLLYENSTIYMKRKKEKFEDMLELYGLITKVYD